MITDIFLGVLLAAILLIGFHLSSTLAELRQDCERIERLVRQMADELDLEADED